MSRRRTPGACADHDRVPGIAALSPGYDDCFIVSLNVVVQPSSENGRKRGQTTISTDHEKGKLCVCFSWGYAIEQALKLANPSEAYFWATHQGAELDLLFVENGKRIGVEAKRVDAPTLTTPSMRIALEDLRLDHLTVLYPGEREYTLSEKVTVVPVTVLAASSSTVPWRRRRARKG